VKLLEFKIDSIARRIIFFAVLAAVVGLHWYIAKWAFANMISLRADRTDIAEIAVGLAPDDPQTHYAAAVLFDKTFLPQDQIRSVSEYETAVSLAPHNYQLWLEYGKALARSGEMDKGESALRRAETLAPNYSVVHWTLGNALVREGKTDEGFAEIRRAVETDPGYAAPAVSIAFSLYEGDLPQIRGVVGDSAHANGALALALAKAKRFDEATQIWKSIPPSDIDEPLTEIGRSLRRDLLSAKKFLLSEVVTLNDDAVYSPGQIFDGGFEQGIKLENAPTFEWQISEGSQPQVLQSTQQAHGGSRCLVLLFNSSDGNGLKQLTQTVAVRPGGKYSFQAFYHSDLKSASPLVWQVVNATDNGLLAEIPLTDPVQTWTLVSVRFVVPSNSDGVILKLARRRCDWTICPINGSLWLDDLSLLPN